MRTYLVILLMTILVTVGNSMAGEEGQLPGGTGKQAVAVAADGHASCKYCGMDREKFAHSRMVIEYNDGMTVATCSLRCAVVDLVNNIDRTPRSIRVGDYATRQLIDAEQAAWVIGGAKAGVMTRNPKWAFAGRDAAELFVRENGGRIASFDETMTAAHGDLYQDTKAIRAKRKMRKMR